MGLGALERELGSSLSAPRLGELRSGVNPTLHVVEEALEVVGASRMVAVRAGAHDELVIEVKDAKSEIAPPG
jgi:hypothetical protein